MYKVYYLDNYQPSISMNGKYTLSHLKNCSTLRIKQTKNYDEDKVRKTPGPGAYDQDK